MTRRYESGIGLGLAAGVIGSSSSVVEASCVRAFQAGRPRTPGSLTAALYQYDDRRSARADNPPENVGAVPARATRQPPVSWRPRGQQSCGSVRTRSLKEPLTGQNLLTCPSIACALTLVGGHLARERAAQGRGLCSFRMRGRVRPEARRRTAVRDDPARAPEFISPTPVAMWARGAPACRGWRSR